MFTEAAIPYLLARYLGIISYTDKAGCAVRLEDQVLHGLLVALQLLPANNKQHTCSSGSPSCIALYYNQIASQQGGT